MVEKLQVEKKSFQVFVSKITYNDLGKEKTWKIICLFKIDKLYTLANIAF